MRILIAGIMMFAKSVLPAQQTPPRFMYIYRDSLKSGVDSAYRAIEEEAAQLCADHACPNPYLAIESLRGAHEVAHGVVWQAADSTLYIFRVARTRDQAEALAREQDGRVFAVRPNLSMPAPAWRTADPDFWKLAPRPRKRLSS